MWILQKFKQVNVEEVSKIRIIRIRTKIMMTTTHPFSIRKKEIKKQKMVLESS